MTDQNIPADLSPADVDAAREWAKTIAAANRVAYTDPARAAARAVLAAYPAPPRPTLADMTGEERAGCQWMQADTEHWGRAVIIIPNLKDGCAALLDRRGKVPFEDHASVTPLPNLPRLEWPGNEKPAPAHALPEGWRLADHPKHGRVIVTRTEPDSEGDIFFVYQPSEGSGADTRWCKPDKLTFLDQEADQ